MTKIGIPNSCKIRGEIGHNMLSCLKRQAGADWQVTITYYGFYGSELPIFCKTWVIMGLFARFTQKKMFLNVFSNH